VLLALFATVLFPGGGWLVFGFFRVFLLAWLVFCLGGILFGLIHRRAHRYRYHPSAPAWNPVGPGSDSPWSGRPPQGIWPAPTTGEGR